MYSYEVWFDGCCLRSDEDFYTEVEAEEEGYNAVQDLLYEEGYAEDGCDEDDFEIKIIEM